MSRKTYAIKVNDKIVHVVKIFPNQNIKYKSIKKSAKINGRWRTICAYPNCMIRPHFNYINLKTGLYCFEHKLPNMKNVYAHICIYPNCQTHASFNYEQETKRLYCAKHKLKGMINIMCSKCIYPNCKCKAEYNFPGFTKKFYCIEHKYEGMILL